MKWLQSHLVDLPLILLVILSSSLFFFRLGWGSLASYDEGWYAGIAQNIVQSGNFITPKFNGSNFIDHPPFALWLMASSFKVFGVNEWAARLPSALLGVLAVCALYGLGKSMANKSVGFMASVMLMSSLWFAFRARTGNLDVPFVSLNVLSIWFVYLSKKDPRWLVSAAVAFALSLLTKTLVGVSLIAPLGLFVLVNHLSPKKIKQRAGWVLMSLIVFCCFLLPWYVYQLLYTNDFFHHHFLVIGLRRRTTADVLQVSANFWLYLQSAVGKWYRIFILSLPLSIIAIIKNKWEYLWVWSWLLVVSLPFYFSSQTEIWHLIPLIPPMVLLLAWHLDALARSIAVYLPKFRVAVLLLVVAIASWQVFSWWWLVVPRTNDPSSEKMAGEVIKRYKMPVYYNSVNWPSLAFYSNQDIIGVGLIRDAFGYLTTKINTAHEPFLLIVAKNDQAKFAAVNPKLKFVEATGEYVIFQFVPK